ncbi:unnamed protein product, partial [Scomber scombrus]
QDRLTPLSTPRPLTPSPSPPIRSLTLCPELPETARGVQKHNLTLSKGQISHSACLWALGTKATEFTSFNWALAFVLGNGGLGSGPCTRPAPPGVHCQGQPNVWPGGPLTDVPLPCHMHDSAHTHSHAYILHLALNILPHEPYNTLRPHQTKSPTAPFEK